MSTSSYDSVYRVGATTFNVPIGLTLAIRIGQMPYQIDSRIRYVAGGSLLLIGVNPGSSLTAAELAVAPYYIMNASPQILENVGVSPYYLSASGATCTVSILFQYSQGASFA